MRTKAERTKTVTQDKYIGSSFDSFLEEEGILEETIATAAKRVLVWEISEAMRAQKFSKRKFALALNVSDTQLLRLLDPKNTSVTLNTMTKAAGVLGKRVEIRLVDDNTTMLHA